MVSHNVEAVSATGIVNRVKKEFSSMGDVDVNFLKNSKSQITGFVAEVKKADGVIEKFKFNVAKIKVGNSTQRGFVFDSGSLVDKNAGATLDQQLNKINEFQIKLSKLRYSALESTKGIKNEAAIADVTKQYDKIVNTLNIINVLTKRNTTCIFCTL
jgi:hypothetical protein